MFPRSTADVALLSVWRRSRALRRVDIYPRGGGTGTNGRAKPYIIVDMSRYMNRIAIEITEEGAGRGGVIKISLIRR